MKKEASDTTSDLIARDCLAVRMRRLNRVISKVYDDALRPLGIRTSQLNILVVIARLSLARPSQICGLLKMDTSTLSRNVDRMRAKGWIEAVNVDTDARAHQLKLTGQGQRLLESVRPAWEKAQSEVKGLLGPAGVAALLRAAKEIAGSP